MTNTSARSSGEKEKVIGERIRALRLAKGLSAAALGFNVGVSITQIQKYESGRNRVSSTRLAQIAQFFEIDIATLLAIQMLKTTALARRIPSTLLRRKVRTSSKR